MPDRLRWDHNAHYHSYLLRQLPPRFARALDVGCGAGAFARLLARRAAAVDAVDLSPVMIAQANAASPQPPNIRWVEGDALALALDPERYEVITAIASVHHMPLDDALRRFRHLLCPGGVVAILGHYRPVTASDYALSAFATIANPIVGVWQAATGRRLPPPVDMPVRDPATTLAEINAAAERHLPGSIVRRHLFYRYSLVWRGPAVEGDSTAIDRLLASLADTPTPTGDGPSSAAIRSSEPSEEDER
jgi:SAM-dependent methyltransferase